jgi:hypothetical protein
MLWHIPAIDLSWVGDGANYQVLHTRELEMCSVIILGEVDFMYLLKRVREAETRELMSVPLNYGFSSWRPPIENELPHVLGR